MKLGPQEHSVTGLDVTVFEAKGKDAIDLIQRLSTNQVLVAPPAVIDNLFADMNGRVVAPTQVWRVEHGNFLVVERSLGKVLTDWLASMTFREDASFIERKDVTVARTILPADYHPTARPAESGAEAHRTIMFGGRFLKETLFFTAPPPPVHSIDAATFRYLAFECGAVTRCADVIVGRNPHEAELSGWLSEQKGCYTGQEVIARLETYQKVQRKVRVFAVDGGDVGVSLHRGDETVADIAAVASLPGKPTLLAAYVKNAALGERELRLKDGRVATKVTP